MIYRKREHEVPADEPFRDDALDRKPLVLFLEGLIGRLEGPFVLALDAPWGSGKTALVHMLMAHLKQANYVCAYFNAWKVDYAIDPLVALVSAIDTEVIAMEDTSTEGKAIPWKKVRELTGALARRGLMAGAKVATMGVLDLEKDVEAVAAAVVGDAVGDVVSAFRREHDLIEQFRASLAKTISDLPESGKHANLVVFVDELDRCRPSFAIELLERVKHLFDIDRLIFVLSIDKQQLEVSTSAVYGSGIQAAEYLRRFIDLEYGVPAAGSKQFTEFLLKEFDIERDFKARKARELSYDRANFVECFTLLARHLNLSLRAQERCMTRLRIVMDQTPADHYLDPILVALLLILRSHNPQLFRRLLDGGAGPDEAMDYLHLGDCGDERSKVRFEPLIHASLIFTLQHRADGKASLERMRNAAVDSNLDPTKRKQAQAVEEMYDSITRDGRFDVRLSDVARKLELAAMIRD